MPVGEVRISPLVASLPSPTAISVPEQPTPLRKLVVPEFWLVQVVPFGDVTMAPLLPTATNWVPHQATAAKVLLVGDVRGVQVTPSGEAMMVPPAPTATKREPDDATPNRSWEVPEVCGDHEALPVVLV